MKIKSLKYRKEEPNTIQYRYDHTSAYKSIYVGRGRPHKDSQLTLAYSSHIPISSAKKKDLTHLCDTNIIPEELQPWYRTSPSLNIEDYIPEPVMPESSKTDTSDSDN